MTDDRIALVEQLSLALGEEASARDPAAPIPWPNLPDVASMLEHVGVTQRWVTGVLRSGGPVDRRTIPGPGPSLFKWYSAGRTALLDALAEPGDRPCWTIGDRTGTAAFWRRRMVFEHAKHLMDARAAGGAGWTVAPELSAADYADGLDELFEVFLARSRASLAPLPAAVELVATDLPRTWRIGRDWTVADAMGEAGASIRATAGHLALALWERADLDDPAFRIEGDPAAAYALRAAPVHPW